jgi:hypothetical protein
MCNESKILCSFRRSTMKLGKMVQSFENDNSYLRIPYHLNIRTILGLCQARYNRKQINQFT